MKALIIAAFVALSASQASASTNPLKIIEGYIGLHERADRAKLQRIMGFDPRKPWCAAMATAVIRKSGRKPPKGSNLAFNWLRFGKPVKLSQARPGDVVIMGRRRGGHVGIFHSRRAGKICLIGGNQSNRVRLSCYAPGSVKGVRR